MNALVIFFLAGSCSLFAQPHSLRFRHLTVEDGLSQNTIQGIEQDKYGFMWFGTWSGLCRYDGYTFTIYRNEENNAASIPDNRIHLLYKDQAGTIWVSFGHTTLLCRYNYETDDFTRFAPSQVPRDIRDSLYRPNRKSIYHVATADEQWQVHPQSRLLSQRNRKTGHQFTYRIDPMNQWALNDEYVNDIYLDKDQVLWVGTSSIGINKADTQQKKFAHYYKKYANPNSLIDNIVRSICEDKQGNLWVGTRNKGITKMDRKTQTFTHYVHQEKDSSYGLTSNHIRKIYCDRFGLIWIGTKHGIKRFDPQTNQFATYRVNTNPSIAHNWVYAITEDFKGDLWIGTSKGLARYDRARNRFDNYCLPATQEKLHIRAILEDKQRNLWVAVEGGGLTYIRRDRSPEFPEKFQSIHYVNLPADAHSLSSNSVFSLIEDEQGVLWVGTDNGLNRFDPTQKKFTRFSQKEGLPDVFIMGLASDHNGHLWISHKKGLTRLNRKTFAVRNFTVHDGLQSNEFSEDAYYRSPTTGELFFGGINGFNSFFPEQIQDNLIPPKVVFTQLKILNHVIKPRQLFYGQEILAKPLYLTNEITLTHEAKSIEIAFAALHYSNSNGNTYAYMLEGFDKDWISTDASKRTASYSNLTPRTYVFKVKAANSDGHWNCTPASLRIVVLPPIWLTAGAYWVYGILLGGVFFMVYRYIVGREKMKNQLLFERMQADKLQELHQLKLQFFTSISHEFRTPLSLIIQPLEKLRNKGVDPDQAERYYTVMARNANRLLKLISQLLDFRRVETGHLHVEATYEDTVEFTRIIADTFHLHALERNITYRFDAPSEAIFAWFDPDKLDKILYNLLSNAFKYTPDQGTITVRVARHPHPTPEADGDVVKIQVADTGVGIAPEAINQIFDIFYRAENHGRSNVEGTGIGLALAKELVSLHQGILSVESEVGKGACFTVLLPVGNRPVTGNEKKVPQQQAPALPDYAFPMPDEDALPVEIADPKAKEGEGVRILLVEDNLDLRRYIQNELEDEFLVFESADGVAGLAKALELVPDLIISDVMMPGMNGLNLCKKVKADERISHIPVILLTARQSTDYKIEGYETGADAYLTKPFNSAVLKARIHNLIESRRQLRERFGKSLIFDPQKFPINVTDEAFINRARAIVEENLSDTGFDSELFADKLKMSRSQLFRKIKALTDQTVHTFITTIRLTKAAQLLATGELSISEVAYQVGYSEPTNFSRSFVKQFGQSPKQYIHSLKELK